jgi:release factor glutamine methyltransferase
MASCRRAIFSRATATGAKVGFDSAFWGASDQSRRRIIRLGKWKATMTTFLTRSPSNIVAVDGVYAPQQDSQLLIDTLESTTVVVGRRILDLCTGSGVIAIAAAQLGAAQVTAWDISPRAVQCARENAVAAGVTIDVCLGSIRDALCAGPYDVVVCNPPYVPTPREHDDESIPSRVGPAWAWDAGEDGRQFLDPLCAAAPDLLSDEGTMLVVHSEFAGTDQSVASLRAQGLTSDVVAWQSIPFGPVLSARAEWLEDSGRLEPGRRQEQLVVVRADKR